MSQMASSPGNWQPTRHTWIDALGLVSHPDCLMCFCGEGNVHGDYVGSSIV